jgi:hypothetical protein
VFNSVLVLVAILLRRRESFLHFRACCAFGVPRILVFNPPLVGRDPQRHRESFASGRSPCGDPLLARCRGGASPFEFE